MRYLLVHWIDETAELHSQEREAVTRAAESWAAEMDARGVRLLGQPLRPVSEAATVRLSGAEVLVSDGPFAETKEQIAGFDLIECANFDEAIAVASQHPSATIGSV
jgi:hypothetical protein